MKEAVIVAHGRSACCRAHKGAFINTHAIDNAAQTLKGVLDKLPGLEPEMIDDVIVGCAMPVQQLHFNPARLIVNRAQLPESISAQTINRLCSSSLQAAATAANAIMAGQEEIIVAGGVDDMTHCFTHVAEEYQDQWIKENYIGGYMALGETAERVADQYGITRQMMEEMAVGSHAKAHAAQQAGRFDSAIVPVTVTDAEGNQTVVARDEGVRPQTTMDSLAALKPCFRENGRVTAATSSQMTDGASFVVMMSADKAKELGLKPLARFVGFAAAGCDATIMGIGPVYAVPKVMKRTGLTLKDMDVIELNEAFAAQALACINELGMDMEKVNPYGGAIALGHPLGATGTILVGKAIDYLENHGGKYALVTMCVGGGQGAAAIFEKY